MTPAMWADRLRRLRALGPVQGRTVTPAELGRFAVTWLVNRLSGPEWPLLLPAGEGLFDVSVGEIRIRVARMAGEIWFSVEDAGGVLGLNPGCTAAMLAAARPSHRKVGTYRADGRHRTLQLISPAGLWAIVEASEAAEFGPAHRSSRRQHQ